MKENIGLFRANRLDNGEVVEGNLIYLKGHSFAYILTVDNIGRIVVDADGNCTCKLIRVMEKSIQRIDEVCDVKEG